MRDRDRVDSGPLLMEGTYRVQEVVYPPGHRQPPHAHPHASVTVVLSGGLRERAKGEEQVAGPLSVVAKPPGVEHADEFGPERTRTLQVTFDPDVALGRGWRDRLLPRWRWLHGAEAARPLLGLWRSLLDGDPGASDAVEDRVLEALAGIGGEEASASDPPAWLEAARRALEDALPRTVPVRHLAEEAGVHPVSLSRAFRSHFGHTLTEHRRRERIRRAAAGLRRTDRQVSRIAHAAGFSDHAHLCREFRRATGLTPSAFRELTAPG